jgi:hypothetical protein
MIALRNKKIPFMKGIFLMPNPKKLNPMAALKMTALSSKNFP